MKMVILVISFWLFQNTQQNASFVKRFQTFLRENYTIASAYLKFLLLYKQDVREVYA